MRLKMSPATEVLRVERLTKVYGSGDLAVRALDNVDFSVRSGELAGLLGPSGSGKTTLLLCIGLILEPTSGYIAFNDRILYDDAWTGVDARRFRRENIGFVFQGHNLIPFLSAIDNIALMLELNGVRSREARNQALELLEYLGVDHRAHDLPARLSGGEQQRVAIGRALANAPPLILADEPTASLDTERGLQVMELLRKVAAERGSAIVVVTHDERMVADLDTTLRLRDGCVA